MKPYYKGLPFFILYVYVSECEPGKFGSNCVHKCDCDGDTPCDPVSGRCLCAPGKMGSRCDIGEPSTKFLGIWLFLQSFSQMFIFELTSDCGVNRFGPDCSERCECHNGGQCNPRNGRCTCLNSWVGPSCQEGNFTTGHPWYPSHFTVISENNFPVSFVLITGLTSSHSTSRTKGRTRQYSSLTVSYPVQ